MCDWFSYLSPVFAHARGGHRGRESARYKDFPQNVLVQIVPRFLPVHVPGNGGFFFGAKLHALREVVASVVVVAFPPERVNESDCK